MTIPPVCCTPDLFAWHGGEVWQLAHADQELDDRALDAHLLDAFDQIRGQMGCAHHLQVGAVRIGIRYDDRRVESAAVDQSDAGCRAIGKLDLGDLGRCLDIHAMVAAESGQRLGDRTHAAANEAPGSLMAVDRADQMMKLDIGSAWIAWSGIDADHATGGVRAL